MARNSLCMMRYRLLVCTALLGALPTLAGAQAWVPPPGIGSVQLGYESTVIHHHLFSQDLTGYVDPPTGYVGGPKNSLYYGDVLGMSLQLDGEYCVIPRLAVTAGVTYLTTRYSGLAPEGPNDDGQFHSSLQDVRIEARYMFTWSSLAITPSVGAQLPLVHYENFGHAAIGRGLNQYPVGISIGRTLEPLSSSLYIEADYTRILIENLDTYNLDRNRYTVDAGWFVSSALSLSGSFSYENAVEGLDWITDLTTPEQVAEHYDHHDIAAYELVRRAGATASYVLSNRMGLSLAYEGVLSGINTHAGQSLSFWISWGFTTRRLR